MDAAAYTRFTDRLLASLSADPEVLGLVALGSMSGGPPGPDAWSDHDFWIVTRTGAQERFRTDRTWMPDAGRVALWHRETAHGLKVVFDDGHLAELAVFDLDELSTVSLNRFRVLLDRADVGARLSSARQATQARVQAELRDPRWEGAQLLTTLLVGTLRAARGERISGHQFVRAYAGRHFLTLLQQLLPPRPGALPDDLDPFRRVELGWPEIAAAFEAALALAPPASARALLDLAEASFGDRTPWPPEAAAAVRRRIAEASMTPEVKP